MGLFAAALAACVDVPVRTRFVDVGPADATPPDGRAPGDMARDAIAGDAMVDAITDTMADAFVDAIADATPDARVDAAPPPDAEPPPDGDPPPDAMVGPCDDAPQLAAVVPLDQLDAVAVLDDDTVLVSGLTADPDGLAERAETRPVGVIPLGEPDAQQARRVPVLLHLSADLRTLRAVYRPIGDRLGSITAIRPVRIGGLQPAVRLGIALTGDRGGHRVVLLDAVPEPGEGAPVDRVVDLATTDPQAHLRWSQGTGGAGRLMHVRDAEVPTETVLDGREPDGTPATLRHWRHHVDEMGQLHFGPYPAGEPPLRYGFLPLRAGYACVLRTWNTDNTPYDAVTPDGNGGDRRGRLPLDWFTGAPCIDPGRMGVGPQESANAENWRIRPDRRFDVGGLVHHGDDFYVAFEVTAEPTPGVEGAVHRVPTLIKYGPYGTLRWWRRPHPSLGDAAEDDQHSRGLAVTPDGDVVLAMTTGILDGTVPWDARLVGEDAERQRIPGFQQRPVGSPSGVAVGWLGRFDGASGDLAAVTYVYTVREAADALPRRPPPLDGFVDTEATDGDGQIDAEPRPLGIRPGLLAVGPRDEVAVIVDTAGGGTTPDALIPVDGPINGRATRPYAWIYSPDLLDLEYASALGPPENEQLARGITPTGLAFTRDGALLVVGHRGGPIDLPTACAPEWTAGADGEGDRGVLMRLRPAEDRGALVP